MRPTGVHGAATLPQPHSDVRASPCRVSTHPAHEVADAGVGEGRELAVNVSDPGAGRVEHGAATLPQLRGQTREHAQRAANNAHRAANNAQRAVNNAQRAVNNAHRAVNNAQRAVNNAQLTLQPIVSTCRKNSTKACI